MKFFILFVLTFSTTAFAGQITLENGRGYVVPDDKVWLIKNAPITNCKVCTADVYIKGDRSNVEINGIIFNGSFNFSFSNEINGVLKLYSGTEIWLGDSRSRLVIEEQSQ